MVVDNLALKVRRLDPVEVADDELARSGRGQVHRYRRPEPPEADDQNPGIEQALLSRLPDFAQADLAGEHRPSQIDIDIPLLEGVVGVWAEKASRRQPR